MTATLHVSLFGRFHIQCGDRDLTDECPRKAQEVLSYLALYRERPHSREALADLLCGETSTAQSKKSLRQALWHLQTVLNCQAGSPNDRLVRAEAEWLQLSSETPIWIDIAVFEQVFARVQGIPTQALDVRSLQDMQSAVQLYKGDLLEGWYQDWCLYERERLQNMYLMLLDKLMADCEAHREVEAGLAYGMSALRLDRARERTHRRMMRLYAMAGDRTAALRQYEHLVASLKKELDVKPAERTVVLYEQIRAGQDAGPRLAAGAALSLAPEIASSTLACTLDSLRQLEAVVENAQHQIQQIAQMVEMILNQRL